MTIIATMPQNVTRNRPATNAAVVGLLGAALYTPVWTGAVKSSGDLGLVFVGFALLILWRAPPLVVVVISAAGGIVLGQTAS